MREHAEPSAARGARPGRIAPPGRAEPPGHAEPRGRAAAPSRTEPSRGGTPRRAAEPGLRAEPAPRTARRRGASSRAPRAKPPPGAQLPYLFVLAATVGALAWMWGGGIQRVRQGTLALAGAMLVGAFARLVLPEARAGMLASRRRTVDVVSLGALGIGLLVAGLLLPTLS